MTTLTDADCQSCGACCQGWNGVDVTQEEADRINEKPRRQKRKLLVVVYAEEFLTMRMEGYKQRCVCLKGEVGKSVSCSIYEQRSRTCSDFRVNSNWCHRSRRRAGLEPPVATDIVGPMQEDIADDDDVGQDSEPPET